ncbi:TetR/AcrR family transcriptional regulator [Amycolatopsis sp. cmx-4-68]|uniref:TetR/AcrR family transcriptional regulator n=1 Tax=Amycolatopsis sp. cmx-4-68 TaxID=2790938 RepID=UPI00397DE7F8
MEEIARAAGVGIGTLYRRFPSRPELLGAVIAELDRRLLTSVSEVCGQEPDSWPALQRLLRGWMELPLCGLISYALATAPCAAGGRTAVDHAGQWSALFRRLVRNAQARGGLRADVEPDEIAVMLSLLARGTGDTTPTTRGRLLTVMLAGLGADQPARLS